MESKYFHYLDSYEKYTIFVEPKCGGNGNYCGCQKFESATGNSNENCKCGHLYKEHYSCLSNLRTDYDGDCLTCGINGKDHLNEVRIWIDDTLFYCYEKREPVSNSTCIKADIFSGFKNV